jgi:hypothetical protein
VPIAFQRKSIVVNLKVINSLTMAHLNPLAVPFALPPPPPGGAPPGVPGAIVAPVNYRELYDTTRLPDAFLGVYAPWYAGMSTSLAGPQVNQPQAVRAGLLALPGEIPLVLLYSAAGPGGTPPMVQALHRVSKYPSIPGIVTQWDGGYYGFGSDLGEGNQILSYALPGDAFHTTDSVQVVEANHMMDAWAANPGAHQLGPYGAGDADVELVRTRSFMAVPPTYVHLFVDKHLTPRDAYTAFHTLATLNGDLVSCSTLEIWLRAQATVSHLVPPVPGTTRSVVTREPLDQPRADGVFQHYTFVKLTQDFPHIRNQGISQDTRNHDLISAIHQESMVRAAIRSAEALEARAPKLPSGKFSDNTVKLMLRVCEVEHETQLPPYWSDLANCAKGEIRILLQAALTARVAETDSASLITPIATKEMVERLNRIEFAGRTENFSTGIHPFMCVEGPPGAAESSAHLYDLIISGLAAPSLSDHAQLAAGVSTPKTLFEMGKAMKTLSLLFDIGLGKNHRLSITWRQFVRVDWEHLQQYLRDFIDDQWAGEEATACCRFLRFLQLRLNEFHNQALIPMAYGYPDIPPFAEEFSNAVKYKLPHVFPMLPAHYLKAAPLGMYATRSSGSSAATGSGGARTPAGKPGEPANPRKAESKVGSGTREVNPSPRAVHKLQMEGTKMKVPDILKAHPVPSDSSGVEMCLSWHCRQSCFTNCNRQSGHTKLSDSDATKLSDYLRLVGTSGVLASAKNV